MKLLYVVAKAEYFLSHRLSLAQFAKQNGFKVAVASTPFTSEFETYSISFKRGGVNLFYELKTLLNLLKVFLKYKPEIVHNVALKPVLYGSILGRMLNIKTINSINGFGYIFTSSQLKAKLLRPFVYFFLKIFLNHKNSTVIVQNIDDYNDCLKILPKANLKIVSGSGVDENYYIPNNLKQKAPFTFVLVARMLYSKGILEYVEAAKIVKQKYPEVRFLLVGDPDLENPETILESTLKEWHNLNYIEWLGHKKNIKEIYDHSHVAVLPSYREGMPKSLLEAMACGLPIITTNVRGCRDLFCDNGYLVPLKNTAEIVKAMVCCIENNNLEPMAQNGRKKIEELYSNNVINSQILNIYKQL